MIKNEDIYFIDRVYEDQSEQFNLNMCIQKAFGESPTYTRQIRDIIERKAQTFTTYATKNFFKPPEHFSVGLELAKESLVVDFGFIEVIEIFYSYSSD